MRDDRETRVSSRSVMTPALDPDPESDFHIFGDSVKSGIVTPLVSTHLINAILRCRGRTEPCMPQITIWTAAYRRAGLAFPFTRPSKVFLFFRWKFRSHTHLFRRSKSSYSYSVLTWHELWKYCFTSYYFHKSS